MQGDDSCLFVPLRARETLRFRGAILQEPHAGGGGTLKNVTREGENYLACFLSVFYGGGGLPPTPQIPCACISEM